MLEFSVGAFLRGRRAIIGYAILGALLFVAFLAASFPYGDTLTSILAPYKLKVVYQSQHTSAPIGAALINVRLISTADPSEQALVQSSEVRLAPTIGSLFFGRPGLNVRADLYGGTVSASIHREGTMVDLSFAIRSVSLEDSDPLHELGALMSGHISGAGSAEISDDEITQDTGQLALSADDLSVNVMSGFPPIRLGALTGNVRLVDGILKISGVEGHGADVNLKADGTVELAQNVADSPVDLKVFLDPTPEGRARLRLFLGFLPHPPGSTPYFVRGRLAAPSIS
jgi:type II secretion system protein N